MAFSAPPCLSVSITDDCQPVSAFQLDTDRTGTPTKIAFHRPSNLLLEPCGTATCPSAVHLTATIITSKSNQCRTNSRPLAYSFSLQNDIVGNSAGDNNSS